MPDNRQLYAMEGEQSKSLLSWNGRVIVHGNQHELEWLFPYGNRVVQCPSYVERSEMLRLKDHPDMASVRWPLHKEDFRG